MPDQLLQRPLAEALHARGVYTFDCYGPDGALKWHDTIDNVVTTVGRNAVLDDALAGSAYTVTGPYLGLISSVSYVSLATTISSGAYTTGTGAVSLTTAASHGLGVGDTFTIASAAGTGSFAALNATFVATTGTTGTTLNCTTAPSLTMTITGGNVTAAGPRIGDTMASHANWTEAGNANAPTYTAPRKTCAWSAASGGSKSLSASLSFAMTGSGTVKGGFIVLGSGAVSTIDNTAGTLLSAGVFTAGDKIVGSGDTVNVSYSMSV